MRLPLQSNCDQNDPREAHQWLFVQIPFGPDQGHTPDLRMLPDWSQRVDDAGYRHVDQIRALADENGMIHVDQLPKQRKRFRAPYRGQQHGLNGSGDWVDMDAEDPAPFIVPDPERFTPHEKAAMAERLYYDGTIKRPEPEVDKASVGTAKPLFRPGEHTPNSVNTYLEYCANDAERRRVIAEEMTGKRRDQILRNPKWKGL